MTAVVTVRSPKTPTRAKREEDKFHDWTNCGIPSPATVEGDRVYIVDNRGAVLCLDVKGMANGNDGPFKVKAVARYYAGSIDGFVLDVQDAVLAPDIEALGLGVRVTDTMMRNDDDKRRLAAEVLEYVDELGVSGQHS